jgi:Tfp pilus assembly protein PilF
VAGEGARELLRQLCDDLRLLRTQAGGPSLRVLGVRLRLGKTQVGAILNGRIRQLPDWDVVKGVVESCHRHARDQGRLDKLSLSTGIDQHWRPRYAAVEYAFRHPPREPTPDTRPDNRPDTVRPVPRQLPGAVRHFTGRAEQLAALAALGADAGRARTVVISAITGTAGVGKTALAVHWAHRIADRFPDGQLYVNLRGFDPNDQAMPAAEAIRRFLTALGVAPQRIPAEPDAQAALYRSELAGRRMLVVLDNARDTAQVRPLLPGAAGCLVLVTSRRQLAGLVAAEGAHPITVDLLTGEEAARLLAQRLGVDRVAAEPDAVAEIVDRCARLPLALAVVAARAATHPHLSLRVVADQLRDARLDTLAAADDPVTDARAAFSWSYRTLSPPAARLFRLFGLHPGADIAAPAAASLAGIPLAAARAQLAELTGASLLVEHAPGRYTCHDLLRAYAAELAHGCEPVEQRRAATGRVLDHYLHTAYAAVRLLYPTRDQVTLAAPRPGVSPEQPADHPCALDWFGAEHAVLTAAVEHAADGGWDTHTWQLAWTLSIYLDRRGQWHDQVTIGRAAVAAADRLADLPARARMRRALAIATTRLGSFDEASDELGRALDLYRQLGDATGQAHTHNAFAYLYHRRDDPARALEHSRQALDLFRAAGHRNGQANALNQAGWFQTLLGDHEQALVSCRQALDLHQELDNRVGQAGTWDSIGYIHHRLGQHAEALRCYQHALTLNRELGDRYYEADTLTHIGDARQAAGDPGAAREAWRQALAIFDDLDHPDADGIRTRLS